MSDEVQELSTNVGATLELREQGKKQPAAQVLEEVYSVIQKWDSESTVAFGPDEFGNLQHRRLGEPLKDNKLSKTAKKVAAATYADLSEQYEPQVLVEELKKANISFDAEEKVRLEKISSHLKPQAEVINILPREKRMAAKRFLQSISLRVRRAEAGIEGFQQLPITREKPEFSQKARNLGLLVASRAEISSKSIVENPKEFKRITKDLFTKFARRVSYDAVIFEEAIAYIFANLDKKGYLEGKKLIVADGSAQRKEIRQTMTRVLKSLREQNRYRYFQIEIIAPWKMYVPGLEEKLGLPKELHGAARVTKIIHDLSEKYNFDPFAEKQKIIDVLAKATKKSELRIAQRIAQLRGISVEEALGRKLRFGEKVRNFFRKKRLKQTLVTAVLATVMASCLSSRLIPLIVKKPSVPIAMKKAPPLPPRLGEEKKPPVPLTKREISPEEVPQIEKKPFPPKPEVKEKAIIKTLIPQEKRVSVPSVAEVKYLPQESYTLKDGETHVIKPEEIIIHWDAQPNSENRSTYITYNGLLGRTRAGDPVSTHFSVGPGGSANGPAVLQMLPMSAGFIQMGILSDGPSKAINIETTGMYYDKELPPEQQTENLIQLILELMVRYKIPLKDITGHLERSPDIGKIDPGQGYLNMIRAKLMGRLINQNRWELIGNPKDWNFHKQVREKTTGEVVPKPTQTPEELLASLSLAAKNKLASVITSEVL